MATKCTGVESASHKLFRCGVCYVDFPSLAVCVTHMRSDPACATRASGNVEKKTTNNIEKESVEQNISVSVAASGTKTPSSTQTASGLSLVGTTVTSPQSFVALRAGNKELSKQHSSKRDFVGSPAVSDIYGQEFVKGPSVQVTDSQESVANLPVTFSVNNSRESETVTSAPANRSATTQTQMDNVAMVAGNENVALTTQLDNGSELLPLPRKVGHNVESSGADSIGDLVDDVAETIANVENKGDAFGVSGEKGQATNMLSVESDNTDSTENDKTASNQSDKTGSIEFGKTSASESTAVVTPPDVPRGAHSYARVKKESGVETELSKPYACSDCPARFSHQSSLSTHRRRHLGKAPYSCDECGKEFWDPSNFRVHMRTHTDDRPYACDICGHRSNQAHDVKIHRRIHTGETPFACTVPGCSKQFRDPSHLRRHKKQHLGIEPTIACELCSAKFMHASILARHMRTHTGEKNFICKVCKARFARLDTLRLHQRTHTGQKPYKCGSCSMSFADRSQCRRHMKKERHGDVINCNLPPKSYKLRTAVKGEPVELDPNFDLEVKATSKAPIKKPTVLQVPLAITKPNGTSGGETTYETIEIELPEGMDDGGDAGGEITYQYGEMLITISRAAVTQLQEAKKEEERAGFHGNVGDSVENVDNSVENVIGSNKTVSDSMESMDDSVGNVDDAVEIISGNEVSWKSNVENMGSPKVGVADMGCSESLEKSAEMIETNVQASSERTSEKRIWVPCKDCGVRFSNYSQFQKHLKQHAEDKIQQLHANTGSAQSQRQHGGDVNNSPSVQKTAEQASDSLQKRVLSTEQPERINPPVHAATVTVNSTSGIMYGGVETLTEHDLAGDITDQEYPLSPAVHALGVKRRRMTRQGKKRFFCGDCDMSFFHRAELRRHSLVHTGEFPYECGYCKKRVRDPSNFQRHIRTHTGEKPYVCVVCKKRFAQAGHLTAHLRTHTGERPYACPQCEARFVESNHLRHHLKTHGQEKPFRCDMCDYSFLRSAELRRHQLIHIGTKDFKCSECPAAFFRQDALRQHHLKHQPGLKMKLASGNRRYACPHCAHSFMKPGFLYRHLNVAHPNRESSKPDAENSVVADALCELATGRRSTASGSDMVGEVRTVQVAGVSSQEIVELSIPFDVTEISSGQLGQVQVIDGVPGARDVAEFHDFACTQDSQHLGQVQVIDGVLNTGQDISAAGVVEEKDMALMDSLPPGSLVVADSTAEDGTHYIIISTPGSEDPVSTAAQSVSALNSVQIEHSALSSVQTEQCTAGTELSSVDVEQSACHSVQSGTILKTSTGTQLFGDSSNLELTMHSILSGQAQLESVNAVEVNTTEQVSDSGQMGPVVIKEEPSDFPEQSPIVAPLRTRSGRERKIKVKFSM